MELNDLEKKLAELSVKRYKRSYYKWGHLLGWLAVPLVFLLFIPNLMDSPIKTWVLPFVAFFLFEWYFVVTTRLIGKLYEQIKNNKGLNH